MTTPQWADLARAVDESGGVFTTNMKVLRTMTGAQRMSEDLVNTISAELTRRGFGHRPADLPIRQEEEVMVYRLGSMGAEVFGVLEDLANRKGDYSTLAEAIRMINIANERAGEERLEALMEMSGKGRKPSRRKRRSADALNNGEYSVEE